MRWLLFALVAMTAVLWWMLIDRWPDLPERLPLLHWREDRTAWFVERSVGWWFGLPAVVTGGAWALGLGGARWLTRRAVEGRFLPLPLWAQVRQLPVEFRVKVMQPMRLAVLFVAVSCLIQTGSWYDAAVELAKTGTGRSGNVAMFAAMATAVGAGWTLARVRARRLGDAFVAAGGRLRPPA